MGKTFSAAQIELPPHLGDFPSKMPVFRLFAPDTVKGGSKIYFDKRISTLRDLFKIEGFVSDAGPHFVIQNEDGQRAVQVFKTGAGFIYFDRELVCSVNQDYSKSLISKEEVKARSGRWLEKHDFLPKDAYYLGTAFTRVSVQDIDPKAAQPEPKTYDTEIKGCYGFKLGEYKIMGPGAKIKVAYVGDQQSEVVYFQRDVDKIVDELDVTPLEAIRKTVAKDFRFAHLSPLEAKIRLTDVTLGYYAAPPANFQYSYFPVYELSGILETRNMHGIFPDPKKGGSNRETLQYSFQLYVPATELSFANYRVSGFPIPTNGSIIF